MTFVCRHRHAYNTPETLLFILLSLQQSTVSSRSALGRRCASVRVCVCCVCVSLCVRLHIRSPFAARVASVLTASAAPRCVFESAPLLPLRLYISLLLLVCPACLMVVSVGIYTAPHTYRWLGPDLPLCDLEGHSTLNIQIQY